MINEGRWIKCAKFITEMNGTSYAVMFRTMTKEQIVLSAQLRRMT